MGVAARLLSEAAKIEAIAATGIENDIARTYGCHLGDGAHQGLGHALIVQPAPGCHGSDSVTWMLRSPLLRLEEVDVTAPSDVERMRP
jgi:hypothetical protein